MTVRHIVLVSLEPGVRSDDPRVLAACAAEDALAAQAPGGQGWRFGADVARRPVSADFAGVGDFESMSAVHDFLEHPTHAEVVRLWAGLSRTVVADLEL
jgi:hypothetical protein